MPCPPYTGSAIDLITRIKLLHNKGVKIHLHYFEEGERKIIPELKNYCYSLQPYKRKQATECLSLSVPYFVNSRCNSELVDNINKDEHPVLLEGLHTTGIINEINNGRKICVRMHNEESAYYKEQARNTYNPAKKTYYLAESLLCKKYTPTLPKKCMYACVTESDQNYLQELGFFNVPLIPPFPSWQVVESKTGVGNLCLFHANLSAAENEKVALWLLCNIFNKVRVPFIIAGKNPPKSVEKAASLCQNTCLVSNPCDSELDDLIQKAHINILPCLNKAITGTPLKLLHALYKGRHCVTTPAMVEGTNLSEACHIGSTSNALAAIISQLYYLPFEEEEIALRKRLLYATYNNEKNIEQFINYLW